MGNSRFSVFYKTFVHILSVLFAVSAPAFSQIVSEADVPDYKLPDLLLCLDGTKATTVEQWQNKRRPEILEMCEREMYGRSPLPLKNIRFGEFDFNKEALGGKATRKQVTVFFNGVTDGPQMDILIYYPNNVKGAVPVFLALNFQGNHAIHPDTAIRLSDQWVWAGAAGAVNNRSTEKSRGSTSSRWPVEMILDHGYALATIYAGDIDPDYYDDFKNGVHALYPELQSRGDNFSTIAAWAWGLSRAMDYFETDPKIDPGKVAVIGFSRMGKAALWAGARDERFAITVSNESGGGGAALSKRIFGEDVARLNNGNPHWFCKNFRKYNNNEESLPFDQHMVIALIAPRPVYIASAKNDVGADSYGEFLAAKASEPVYHLFGSKGLPAQELPPLNTPVHGSIGYHIRSGNHDITPYDWEQFFDFADKHFFNL